MEKKLSTRRILGSDCSTSTTIHKSIYCNWVIAAKTKCICRRLYFERIKECLWLKCCISSIFITETRIRECKFIYKFPISDQTLGNTAQIKIHCVLKGSLAFDTCLSLFFLLTHIPLVYSFKSYF